MNLKSKSLIVIFLILIIDQVSKIWIKTSMPLGASIPVFDNWFLIRFIENRGMAFGIDIPGDLGKPALTIFRIIAAVIISFYLRSLIIKKAPAGFIICVSMVLAGAIGNIIDSLFYGMIFSESNYFEAAKIFPAEGGYASFLHGRVVDMLYFQLLTVPIPIGFLSGMDRNLFSSGRFSILQILPFLLELLQSFCFSVNI